MAKAMMKLPDELIKKITSLEGKTDEICEKALTEGAKIVENKVKSNLRSVIGNGTIKESRSTGELISALGITPVLIDKNGNYNIKIGFDEPRKNGVANAMLANIIEYGKVGQPPKPFLKPAKSSTRTACQDAIKSALESEINKL